MVAKFSGWFLFESMENTVLLVSILVSELYTLVCSELCTGGVFSLPLYRFYN